MRTGSCWGGMVDLALCAQMRRVRVDVYNRGRGGFLRIASFDCGALGGRLVDLCYGSQVHYGAS